LLDWRPSHTSPEGLELRLTGADLLHGLDALLLVATKVRELLVAQGVLSSTLGFGLNVVNRRTAGMEAVSKAPINPPA